MKEMFMSISLSDFDYPLPDRLIAQQPAQRRDASRLMHLSRKTGMVSHHAFSGLPSLLQPGDLLVINDTKVIPAKFFCSRASGAKLEGLYLQTDDENRWEVMLKNTRRCKPGEFLKFLVTPLPGATSDAQAEMMGVSAGLGLELLEHSGRGRWLVKPSPALPAEEILKLVGVPPLPPYIKRPDAIAKAVEDQQRYQTVYAARPGAVAAPTAGLHFTDEILAELAGLGVTTARVTLHVGLGTFEPVKCDDLAEHDMHTERFELSAQVAEEITLAKNQGRRIVAVGTTSVRVLESVAARHGGKIQADRGQTNLFLYPPSDFHVVDALITNFHLPKSTLLMLVASFCDPGGLGGIQTIINAYAQAVQNEYRFFSYGDAMLID